ncbi:MAG: RNA polymerase sigma factor [Phycisphaerae bacterium]|nr:RNA polymerase sigma factor [Gemmatimonadaceae bacterium]
MTLPDATPVADATIVRQVLGGNTEAFSHLVQRYHDRCLRLATHIVGNTEDAEDVVQESFLRAYRFLGSYQERDKFSAWLLRIVVNQCRTTVTRAKRHGVVMPLHDDDVLALPSVTHSTVDQDATRDELARAMEQLAPDQREAVVLRFSDELTFEEMAAVTGVGVSALKMRVQRACRRLRALLTEDSHV